MRTRRCAISDRTRRIKQHRIKNAVPEGMHSYSPSPPSDGGEGRGEEEPLLRSQWLKLTQPFAGENSFRDFWLPAISARLLAICYWLFAIHFAFGNSEIANSQ